jgi:hypothetical protein
MGVPHHTLPEWDDLQLMVAQLATQPLLDDAEVATKLRINSSAEPAASARPRRAWRMRRVRRW